MENTRLNTSQHTHGATLRFPFYLLKQITNNFSEDRIIGSGAYGVVYKGVLDNGETIAVKKLMYKPPDHDSEKQFLNECTNLINVQHQNIVRLVGYCYETYRQCVEYGGTYVLAEENERAICFEYLHGGSLDKHVSDEPCILDWDTCYKIINGVCEGSNHLHNGYKDYQDSFLQPEHVTQQHLWEQWDTHHQNSLTNKKSHLNMMYSVWVL